MGNKVRGYRRGGMSNFDQDAWEAVVDIERHRAYNCTGEDFGCK